MAPPKVLASAKPTSSSRINRTFGAPLGGASGFGQSGVETSVLAPIFPLNAGSGWGSTFSAEEGWTIAKQAISNAAVAFKLRLPLGAFPHRSLERLNPAVPGQSEKTRFRGLKLRTGS